MLRAAAPLTHSQSPVNVKPCGRGITDRRHEKFAHIVKRNELTDAMVLGKEITALCGKKWIPSRDPEKFPVCPDCRDRLSSMK